MLCNADPYPGDPQNCVDQPLACDQYGAWSITATSCRFSSDSRGYASYDLGTFRAGDNITITVHSDYFDPGVSIYRNGGTPLASAFGKQFSKDATLTYLVPTTGPQDIAIYGASSSNPNAAGEFFVSLKCGLVPCPLPQITTQPADAHIHYGGNARLFMYFAPTNNPLSINWYNSKDPLSSIGSGDFIELHKLTATNSYFATVSSACGSIKSQTATVTVDPPTRRRSANH